mgnify:CR=1 FL=1
MIVMFDVRVQGRTWAGKGGSRLAEVIIQKCVSNQK